MASYVFSLQKIPNKQLVGIVLLLWFKVTRVCFVGGRSCTAAIQGLYPGVNASSFIACLRFSEFYGICGLWMFDALRYDVIRERCLHVKRGNVYSKSWQGAARLGLLRASARWPFVKEAASAVPESSHFLQRHLLSFPPFWRIFNVLNLVSTT